MDRTEDFEERHYIREGTMPAMQKRPITNRTPEEEAAGDR